MKRLYLALLLVLVITPLAFAASVLVYPKFQAFDSNGDPLSGGKLYSYQPGTSTAKATYSNSTLATANANPTILDSRGEALIYMNGSYKFVLKDSSDTLIWTMDNVAFSGEYVLGSSEAFESGVTNGASTITLSSNTVLTGTSVSVPQTVSIKALNGTSFYSASGSGTILNIHGPFDAGLFAVFNTAQNATGVTPVFHPGSVAEVYPEWYGAKTTSADNTIAINSALENGKTVLLTAPDNGYYKITGQINIAVAGTKLLSYSGAEIRQDTAGIPAIVITASNVDVEGLRITGKQNVAYSANEVGVSAYGLSSSAYLKNVNIRNNKISTFGGFGISTEFVESFKQTDNTISNVYHAGIQGLQVRSGQIDRNNVSGVTGVGSAQYGIVLSRQASDSISTYPHCSDVVISNNIVSGVSSWEGIDIHGGFNIAIVGNGVTNCRAGIVATAASGTAGTEMFAPKNITISGNVVDSGRTDGTAYDGISFTGAYVGSTAVDYATGSVAGNSVSGYGLQSETTSGGITFRTTRGLTVTGNNVLNASPVGILARHTNAGFNITGNVVTDTWSTDIGNAYAVRVSNPSNSGYIGGNSLVRGEKQAAYVMTDGIRIVDVDTNNIMIGPMFTSGVTNFLADSATAVRSGRGSFGTTYATSGATEAVLAGVTIPANSMGVGNILKVTAAGTKAGAVGNKTLNFYYGRAGTSTTMTFNAAANDTNDWRLDATVEYAGPTAQRITWVGYNGATPAQGYDTVVSGVTEDVLMEIRGLCANAGDTIYQTQWVIEKR